MILILVKKKKQTMLPYDIIFKNVFKIMCYQNKQLKRRQQAFILTRIFLVVEGGEGVNTISSKFRIKVTDIS